MDNKLPFALSFERQYAGPLDPTMVFATEAERMAYLSSPLCYPGQIVTCTQFSKDKNIYIVNRTKTDYIIISNTIASISGLQNELNLKAAQLHTHTIANITNLQASLDGKAAVAHTHVELNDVLVYYYEYEINYIEDEENIISNIKSELDFYPNLSNVKFIYVYNPLIYPSEPLIFNAVRGQVDAYGFMSEEGVLNIVRLPNYADIRRLQDGKAALSHEHSIANIHNLQNKLDAKAAELHYHTIANIISLQAALDGKAALSHVHTIANVTDLQATLDSIWQNIEGQLSLYDYLSRGNGIHTGIAITSVIGSEKILVGGELQNYTTLTPAQLRDYTINSIGVTQWTQSGANSSLGISWDLKATMNNNNFTIVVRLSHNKLGTAWASTDEVNIFPFGAMTGIAHCKTLECVVNSSSDTGASIGLVGYNLFAAAQNAYPTTMQQCNEINETAMVVNPNDLYSSSYYSDAGKLPLASTVRLQFKSSPTLHATLATERTRTFYLHGLLLNN